MLFVTLIFLISFQNIQSYNAPCYNQNDAANCDNIYKCCSANKVCGTTDRECDPANGGQPMVGHCYYLQPTCLDCCIKTNGNHYCGTKDECDEIRKIRAIWFGIVITYLILVIIFTSIGIYKYLKTKNQIQEIFVLSNRFKQLANNLQENNPIDNQLDQSSVMEFVK